MKRNPLYSPNAKSEQNGYVNFTFAFINGAKQPKPETKQEKFNRIFQVEDAKIIEE